MRDQTLAQHVCFDADPATKAVAVPLHQTAAYQFASVNNGAAFFNPMEEAYSRIADPIVALEGAAGAAAMRSNFRQVAR
jgi:O-acetylhomoserine (thiol)-lyase